MDGNVSNLDIKVTGETKQAVSSLKKLQSALQGVVNPLKQMTNGMMNYKDGIAQVKIGLKGLRKTIGEVIKSSSKLSTFTKKFLTSVKRIALYRSIRFLVSTFTQMVKTGLDNIYNYSTRIGGQFAKDMDTLATMFQYAGNSIASFTSQLISALTPALTVIANKIAEIFTWLSKLIAVAMGKHTFTQATVSAKKYGEQLKATQNVLAGFDELNVLSTGSGSGTDTNYADMFEEVAISGEEFAKLQNTLDKLKTAVELVGIAFATWRVADLLTKIGLIDGGLIGLIGTIGKFLVKNAPIVLAIAGITSALVYLWKTNDNFRNACIDAWKSIKEAFTPVLIALKDLTIVVWEAMKPLLKTIGDLVAKLVTALAPVLQTVGELLAIIITAITPIITAIVTVSTKITTVLLTAIGSLITLLTGKLVNALDSVSNKAKLVVTAVINLFKKLPDAIRTVMNNVIKWVEKAINNISTKFNSTGLIRGLNKILGTSISLPTVSIPRLEHGGILEDGLFTMNRGEIAGKFNNGTSVVANNEQIIEGIKRGVMEAMANSSQNVTFVVEGDPQGMFNVMRKEANNYRVKTGKFAF